MRSDFSLNNIIIGMVWYGMVWYEVGMLKVSEAEKAAAPVSDRYSKYLDRGLLALRRWPLGSERQRYATT